MQIAPPFDGGLAARRIYRVGDNKKSHVQINDEGARRRLERTYKPFNSHRSRSQLQSSPPSDWILGKAALKLVYLFSWRCVLYVFFTAALWDHDCRKNTGKGKDEIILLKGKQTIRTSYPRSMRKGILMPSINFLTTQIRNLKRGRKATTNLQNYE